MEKYELLDWLQEEDVRWEVFLDQIGIKRMELPGVNGVWSMKDMVAHLTGWNQWLVSRLQAAQRGDPEPLPPWPVSMRSEDEVNMWIYETNCQRPVDDILAESRQSRQRIIDVIEELPDDVRVERIEPNYYLVWVNDKRFEAGEFYDHFHDDHEPDVRAWLARVEKQ